MCRAHPESDGAGPFPEHDIDGVQAPGLIDFRVEVSGIAGMHDDVGIFNRVAEQHTSHDSANSRIITYKLQKLYTIP